MVLLRCINCSRHLLIHTFIRTVAGHNHYSIYVIKKEREEAIHTVVTLKYMQRTLWSWSMIFFVCCYWWRIFRFAVAFWWWLFFFFFNFWFQVESLCSFLVYIILIMVRFVILFGVVICIANECWRALMRRYKLWETFLLGYICHSRPKLFTSTFPHNTLSLMRNGKTYINCSFV